MDEDELIAISSARGISRAFSPVVGEAAVPVRPDPGSHVDRYDAWLSDRRRAWVAAIVPYLAFPFDLVPDFVPVAGYLDDAVIVGFVLRHVLRGSGPAVIEQHWPGPRQSLRLILRLAGYASEVLPLKVPSPANPKAHKT